MNDTRKISLSRCLVESSRKERVKEVVGSI